MAQDRQLSPEENAFLVEARTGIGEIAEAAAKAVLLDGAKRFMGLSEVDIALIRQIAANHGVKLPI